MYPKCVESHEFSYFRSCTPSKCRDLFEFTNKSYVKLSLAIFSKEEIG